MEGEISTWDKNMEQVPIDLRFIGSRVHYYIVVSLIWRCLVKGVMNGNAKYLGTSNTVLYQNYWADSKCIVKYSVQLAFKLSDVRKMYVHARITLKNRFFSLHLNNQMFLAQLFVIAKKETKFLIQNRRYWDYLSQCSASLQGYNGNLWLSSGLLWWLFQRS